MSAWIVGNESINNIVNSFYWYKHTYSNFKERIKKKFKIDLDKVEDADLNEELRKFGQLLVDLNDESVNQRYNKKDKPFEFVYSEGKGLGVFQFLKSVECLTYQSCEGNCDKTELYKFLIEVEEQLRSNIIGEIEEYKNTKWE